jgi:4-amino-4-deoxy-L-arabinose transferase-like glycosyltransferase
VPMNKKTVAYICLFGLLIRATYAVFFTPSIVFQDEERFWMAGLSVAENLTLTTSDKFAHDMPLTGMLVGFTAWVSGHSVLAVKLIFVVISAITIYVIAALAHEIYPSRQTGLIAALIASCYPYFIFYSSLVLSETLFLFFVTLLFLNLLKWQGKRAWRTGVIAGFAHLTRPTLLYFLPVIWAWQWLIKKVPLKYIALGIFLFVLMVVPWGVRNNFALGQFHIGTTGSGQALWEGNNPWNDNGGVSSEFSDPLAYLAELPQGLSELETDQWKKDMAVAYIKSDPNNFFELAIKKFVRFWNVWPNSVDYQSWGFKLIALLSFGPILLLSLSAVFVFRQKFSELSIIYGFVGYYTVIHMITIGSIRYRFPLEPLLVALAAAVLAKLIFGNTEEPEK